MRKANSQGVRGRIRNGSLAAGVTASRSRSRAIPEAVSAFVYGAVLALVAIAAQLPASARVLYLSSSTGNDGNAGTSPALAWRTFARLEQASLTPGDSVLLKRGDLWREELIIGASGAPDNPIYIGTYGVGEKPIISGADAVSNWTPETIQSDDLAQGLGAQLKALWNFDDSGPAQTDASSNRNALQAKGYPILSTDRKQGSTAALLDGFSQAYFIAYSKLSADYPLKNSGSAPFAIGGWVKYLRPATPYSKLYTFSSRGNSAGLRLQMDALGRLQAALVRSDNSTACISADASVSVGTWYHVVVRWDGAELALFVNGVKQSGTERVSQALTTKGDVVIGADQGAASGFQPVSVDEWFAIKSALSDASVAAIYSNGFGRKSYTAYSAPASALPSQVFEDSVRLNWVATQRLLGPGAYSFDPSSSRVYVRCSDDLSPVVHAMEMSRRASSISQYSRSHIVIESIVLEKSTGSGFASFDGGDAIALKSIASRYHEKYGIYFYTATHPHNQIYISGVDVYGNKRLGILHYNGGDGILIENSTVHHNCSSNVEDSTAGIKIVSDGLDAHRQTNVEIRLSTVWANGLGSTGYKGVGIWLDTVGVGARVHHNTLHDNRNAGILVEWAGLSGGQTVDHNVVYQNGVGILLGRRSHNCLFAQNTAYANDINFQVYGETGEQVIGIKYNRALNNIFFGASVLEMSMQLGGENDGLQGLGNTYEYNCIGLKAQKSIEWGAGVYFPDVRSWERAYGHSSSSPNTDPLFVNAENGDFALQVGSPCRDAGLILPGINDGTGGSVRFDGIAPDLGAKGN